MFVRGFSKGLVRPFGVRPTSDGGFYVTDLAANMLSRVSSNLECIWSINVSPSSRGAHSIAIADDGKILVTEFYDKRLTAFSHDGRKIGTFAKASVERPWLLSGPAGVERFPDGCVIVADSGSHSLQRFAPDGRFDAWHDGRSWKVNGAPTGKASPDGFDSVHACIGIPDGRLLVADTWNHCVRFFSSNGRLQRVLKFSALNSSAEMFVAPVAIALYGQGFVVSEYGHPRLQYFDFDGCFRGWLGVAADDISQPAGWREDPATPVPSKFLGGFNHPYDVKSFGEGLIVADTDNARVQCLSFK